ncbi:MAG: AMP-binding protein [Oscillospiraceae bacterium]
MAYFLNLEQYAEKTALIDACGKEYTYKQLVDCADRFAEKIAARSLLFLMCSNTPASVIGYVGCLRHDIVPVMINKAIDSDLLNSLVEIYQPEYLFFPADKLLYGYTTLDSFDNATHTQYLLGKCNKSVRHKLLPELGLLLTTSGSTGSPKLVRQSYKNLQSNTNSIIEYLKIDDSDKAITTLPMHYTYGLSIVNTHLAAGACLILTEATVMKKEFWESLKHYGATTFGGVPYIFEMLKKLRFERMDLPSLRYLTQAGGHLSKELVEYFADICSEKDIEFIVMYGQTEATARMAYLPWKNIREKSGSIGIAIPGGRFYLLDNNNNEISAVDEVGELAYEGDNVTLGYAENSEDLAMPDENKGRLITGDMAKVDAEGFYFIVGRKKRFLKLFGSRINLDEVEVLLKAKEWECACAGTDDNLKIYIINESDKENVVKYLSESLSISRAGFSVIVIDAIPRNEAGKILYSALN